MSVPTDFDLSKMTRNVDSTAPQTISQLTPVWPFDVIAFILLLNFDGLRSKICKYSSVNSLSVSVVTFSST